LIAALSSHPVLQQHCWWRRVYLHKQCRIVVVVCARLYLVQHEAIIGAQQMVHLCKQRVGQSSKPLQRSQAMGRCMVISRSLGKLMMVAKLGRF
jgi:hypothetical protein